LLAVCGSTGGSRSWIWGEGGLGGRGAEGAEGVGCGKQKILDTLMSKCRNL